MTYCLFTNTLSTDHTQVEKKMMLMEMFTEPFTQEIWEFEEKEIVLWINGSMHVKYVNVFLKGVAIS